MESPFRIVSDEEILMRSLYMDKSIVRPTLVTFNIADIHFGALDPKEQYDALEMSFIKTIEESYFDIIAINGDTFHHKNMANSDTILYAMKFIDKIVSICRIRENNPTLMILAGTRAHDSDQLKLFYNYLTDNSIDIRIIEQMRFEYVKGAKILCIPEEYGKGEEYYNKYLRESGHYDFTIMHGMLDGALYLGKTQESGINSDKAPIFKITDFVNCLGPIISGHIHTMGCHERYFYYCGSPLRWSFGEENEKGFLAVLINLDDASHFTYFIPNEHALRYKDCRIDPADLNQLDPLFIIQTLIKNVLSYTDYLRLIFSDVSSEAQLANYEIIKKYFKSNNRVKILMKKSLDRSIENGVDEEESEYNELSFLTDTSLSSHEKLVMYINYKKGYEFITMDKYLSIMNEK